MGGDEIGVKVERFVTAFAGRRDAYQVPLALHEAGLLDMFIADAYVRASWARRAQLIPELREKALRRTCDALPDSRVRSRWLVSILEATAKRCGVPAKRRWAMVDRYLSRAAASRAAATRSHLLLYEPYAWEAFTTRYAHRPLRVLFHFHAHPDLETEILEADAAKNPPETGPWLSVDGGLSTATPGDRRSGDSWRHADLILCASSFTRSSLVHAGADPARCRVIPYGIDTRPLGSDALPVRDRFEVLFVGTGLQRKGLHHLLIAWRLAQLPPKARLTLVCRELDPQMWPLIRSAEPSVRLITGATTDELIQLYEQSHLLVVPSLVEGFGHIFLEALSFGCPVLGTANTCLPDLGKEANGVFTVTAGDVLELVAFLKRHCAQPNELLGLRIQARNCAERFTWPDFRLRLSGVIEELLRGTGKM